MAPWAHARQGECPWFLGSKQDKVSVHGSLGPSKTRRVSMASTCNGHGQVLNFEQPVQDDSLPNRTCHVNSGQLCVCQTLVI